MTIWHSEHSVRFTPDQQEAINGTPRRFRRSPYITPSYKDVVSAVGEDVTLSLVEDGQLVRISPEVLPMPENCDELLAWVKETIADHGGVNVGQLSDAFNTSRKCALAFPEYLDDQRITKRLGDE